MDRVAKNFRTSSVCRSKSHEGNQACSRTLMSLTLNVVVLSLQTLDYVGCILLKERIFFLNIAFEQLINLCEFLLHLFFPEVFFRLKVNGCMGKLLSYHGKQILLVIELIPVSIIFNHPVQFFCSLTNNFLLFG